MPKYIVKRVFMALLTVLIVACITFFLMHAIPGNPWLSDKTPSETVIKALNEKYGLDKPLHVQLGKYLGNMLRGDFGKSIKMQKNREVATIIAEKFPVSGCPDHQGDVPHLRQDRRHRHFVGGDRGGAAGVSVGI